MKNLIASIVIALFVTSSAFAANMNDDTAEVIAEDTMNVGTMKAELIVKERKNGDFKDCEELAERVKGVGPVTCEKNPKMEF